MVRSNCGVANGRVCLVREGICAAMFRQKVVADLTAQLDSLTGMK